MLTDEQIIKLWDGHTVPVFGKIGINPIVFARSIEAEALKAHQQAIEAAVLAEREACAQICNDMHSLRGANADHKYMADKCAMHIRARTQPMRIPDAHKEETK